MPGREYDWLPARAVAPCSDRSIAQEKVFDTLCAALALRGHHVHTLANGEYAVCRWGMSRVCPSLDALQAFARQIGALG